LEFKIVGVAPVVTGAKTIWWKVGESICPAAVGPSSSWLRGLDVGDGNGKPVALKAIF